MSGPPRACGLNDDNRDRFGSQRDSDVVDRDGRLVDGHRNHARGADRGNAVDTGGGLFTEGQVVVGHGPQGVDRSGDIPTTVGIETQFNVLANR